MGAFHKQNRLLFWMPDCDKDVLSGVREVLSEENVHSHPHGIAIRRTPTRKSERDLLSWRINPHTKELVLQVLSLQLNSTVSLDTALSPLNLQVIHQLHCNFSFM